MSNSTTLTTPIEQALWANEVQRLCLVECNGDIDAALSAADMIVRTQPMQDIKYDSSPVIGPAFPTSAEEYPRNKSKQFIPKKVLAKASRVPEEYIKLKEV